MKKRITTVLFDMDGVLINTEPLHFRMWSETFRNHGLEIDYDIYKGCIGTTHDFLMQLIWDNYGVDFRGDKEIGKEATAIKTRIVTEEGFPGMPFVKEMLETLKKSGLRLAIASSSPVSFIDMAMENLQVREYFETIGSGDYVKHSKPAPDIYLYVADQMGVSPEECVVLEDSTNGCKSATAAGMTCIGFRNPDSGEQDLSFSAAVIESLLEFTPELIHSLPDKLIKK